MPGQQHPTIMMTATSEIQKGFHKELTDKLNELFVKYPLPPQDTIAIMSQVVGQIISSLPLGKRGIARQLVQSNIQSVLNRGMQLEIQGETQDVLDRPKDA